ncbi:hypothetical protein P8452_40803 [Trifolium repens]|jgi:hypothetical protein|nr:hypothetical protein P8452_40803 [Trifolium repens]
MCCSLARQDEDERSGIRPSIDENGIFGIGPAVGMEAAAVGVRLKLPQFSAFSAHVLLDNGLPPPNTFESIGNIYENGINLSLSTS